VSTAIGFDPGSKKTAWALLRLDAGKVLYVGSSRDDNPSLLGDIGQHSTFVVETPFAIMGDDTRVAAEFGGYIVYRAQEDGYPVLRFRKSEWVKKLCYPDKVSRSNSKESKALIKRHLYEKVHGLPKHLNEHQRDAVALAWCGLVGAKE
jgi:Holliday junction resolvasome RuvABC endonuclease subunit